MNRLLATLILAVLVARAADAAPKRAYKARQQEAAEADAQPSAASSPATPSANYERELQAAREDRDKKLQSLDEEGMDRRTLEKRKTEIFAEYAKILAAMRDKYEASNPPPPPAPTTTKRKPTRTAGTARATPPPPPPARSTRNSRSNGRANQDTQSALADAERKLQEENDRHAAKMEELNAQLRQAQSSGNKREVRRVQKSIEKENNTYNAKRPILERRVVDLGGKIVKPSPAEARAQ